MQRPLSDVYDIIERLAQMWIVAKCRCAMRKSKSESHVDCFHVEPWIEEEFNQCAQAAREIEEYTQSCVPAESDCELFSESLDSLQAESTVNHRYC